MTDEPTAVSEVEARNAMLNMASLTWVFFNQLLEEGFDTRQALTLTGAWIQATCSPPRTES